MATATVTSKGQITIPASVRQALHVEAGDRVEFVEIEAGASRSSLPPFRHGAQGHVRFTTTNCLDGGDERGDRLAGRVGTMMASTPTCGCVISCCEQTMTFDVGAAKGAGVISIQ